MEDLTNDMGNPISYPTKIDDNSVSHLEQNHTTFLLVDNGQIAETNEPKDDMIRAALEYRVNFEVGYTYNNHNNSNSSIVNKHVKLCMGRTISGVAGGGKIEVIPKNLEREKVF